MQNYNIPHRVHDYLSWMGACLTDSDVPTVRQFLRRLQQNNKKRVLLVSGSTPSRLVVRDLLFLFSASRWMCLYCGCPLTLGDNLPTHAQLDHIIAVYAGGTNHLDNLVPACAQCNGRKGGRAFVTFVTDRQAFVKRYVDMWARFDYYDSDAFYHDLPPEHDNFYQHISIRYRRVS